MGSDEAQKTENVRAVARIRPLSQQELASGAEQCIDVSDDCKRIQVTTGSPADDGYQLSTRLAQRTFVMDEVIEGDQVETFERSGVKDLLDAAIEGFSATAFAYGQTGSGKTYTMAGPNAESSNYDPDSFDGIIPRSVRYIFEQTAARAEQGKGGSTIRASFLEVYNEQVRDLWNPGASNLTIREYPQGYWQGFYVEDLYIIESPSYDEMMVLLWEGMRRRAVGAHNLNKDSSRSHSILTFYIESEEIIEDEPSIRFGKIAFVDLAGSERLRDTQSKVQAEGRPATAFKSQEKHKMEEMLKETGNINKSLFTLGKVISALGSKSSSQSKVARGSKYVPYRDSKLTKLLMDSLGGSSKALMFACCSPADSYLEETLATLSYAMRARNITNNPSVQLDPHEQLVRDLKAENTQLRSLARTLATALRECAEAPDAGPTVAQIVAQLASAGQLDLVPPGNGTKLAIANGGKQRPLLGDADSRSRRRGGVHSSSASSTSGGASGGSRPWSSSTERSASTASSSSGGGGGSGGSSAEGIGIELSGGAEPALDLEFYDNNADFGQHSQQRQQMQLQQAYGGRGLSQSQRQSRSRGESRNAKSHAPQQNVPQQQQRRRMSRSLDSDSLYAEYSSTGSRGGVAGGRGRDRSADKPLRQRQQQQQQQRRRQPSSDGGSRETQQPISNSWDSGTWQSYQLSDLPSPAATDNGLGLAGANSPYSTTTASSSTLTTPATSARRGTANIGSGGGAGDGAIPVARRPDLLERKKSVEQELAEWEQWNQVSQSINQLKQPRLPQQSSPSASSSGPQQPSPASLPTKRSPATNTGGTGGGGVRDWRAGLSELDLARYRDLERARDAATTVESMSAAMKELQQLERAFLGGGVGGRGGGSSHGSTSTAGGDSLDTLLGR